MNKPNWKDAPEWANWLAMDADGSWFWFENEPAREYHLKEWDNIDGRYVRASEPASWKDTKEPRPCDE